MSLLKEALFVALNPKRAVEAKILQISAAFDSIRENPTVPIPDGTTIEEIQELPVSEVAKLINGARKQENLAGGIQLEDWSKADQERMLRGEKPKGVPLHRNL